MIYPGSHHGWDDGWFWSTWWVAVNSKSRTSALKNKQIDSGQKVFLNNLLIIDCNRVVSLAKILDMTNVGLQLFWSKIYFTLNRGKVQNESCFSWENCNCLMYSEKNLKYLSMFVMIMKFFICINTMSLLLYMPRLCSLLIKHSTF